jgi:hypothetical protein
MDTGLKTSGGEGGIRTLGTGVSPYNGLANRRIRPLCHLSGLLYRLLADALRDVVFARQGAWSIQRFICDITPAESRLPQQPLWPDIRHNRKWASNSSTDSL